MVPANRLQSPPDGPRRRRAVRAAVPRSVQLLLRPARADRHRHGRGGDARTLPRGGETGGDDALGSAVLDVVERRAPHHGLLPQYDRAPDGVDRQPDAHRDPVRSRPRAAQGRLARTHRAATVALPAVDRLLHHRQPRDPRLRLALSRDAALQHLPYGTECDRARRRGSLDGAPSAHRGREGGRPQGQRARHRPDRAHAGRPGAAEVPRPAARPGAARPARLHSPVRPGGFPTATKFVNTLIKNGVTVLRATRDFDVAGRHYPAQSYAVLAAQAFRPHVLDMFEPQDHPNDFQFPGGPPIPPYDNAGWTLAFQMGVSFDRILDRFEGPFEPVRDTATPPAGTVSHADGATGFLLSHRVNDAAVATNRLLAKGEDVDWLAQPVTANGREYPAGTTFIPATPASVPLVR